MKIALKSLCECVHLCVVLLALCSYLNTKRKYERVLVRMRICVGVWRCDYATLAFRSSYM